MPYTKNVLNLETVNSWQTGIGIGFGLKWSFEREITLIKKLANCPVEAIFDTGYNEYCEALAKL